MRKHLLYAWYIIRHKWFVFQAGRVTKASLWRLVKHDWSKLLPSEWIPYANNFYGSPERATAKMETTTRFQMAWRQHISRNDHHWEYWLDDALRGPQVIPNPAVREMVADWLGANRAVTGAWQASKWYASNRGRIQLHPWTREFVEALLQRAVEAGKA